MGRLKRKDGKAVFMALLLVLAAMAVSSVILLAAVTAARQLKSDRAEMQDYLTLSSAAELVRDSILNTTFTEERMTVLDEDGMVVSTDVDPAWTDGLMTRWLKAGVGARGNGTGCADSITVTVGDGSGNKAVQADFSMDADLAVKVKFYLEGDEPGECRMTLTLSGTKDYTTSTFPGDDGETVLRETTRVTWDSAKIVKGAAA